MKLFCCVLVILDMPSSEYDYSDIVLLNIAENWVFTAALLDMIRT